jgi:hypothetical protein
MSQCECNCICMEPATTLDGTTGVATCGPCSDYVVDAEGDVHCGRSCADLSALEAERKRAEAETDEAENEARFCAEDEAERMRAEERRRE